MPAHIGAGGGRRAELREAWRINGPRWNGAWTSDGWKAIVAAIRAPAGPGLRSQLRKRIGIIGEGPVRLPLSLSLAEIDALDYYALAANPEKWTGLCRQTLP